MASAEDKVSVIITTYKLSRYLPEAIRSVFLQANVPVEIIVVDDGSPENSAEALAPVWDRITYIRLKDNRGGPAAPRNLGIRAATGRFIAVLDGDDVMLPGKLRDQVDFLNAHPDIPLVFTDFRNFSEAREYGDFLSDHVVFRKMPKTSLGNRRYRLDRRTAYETLLEDNFIGTSGVVFRLWLIQEIGGFDESLKRSEDFDFWLRVTRRFDLGFIDKVYHRRRLHGGNISSSAVALRDHLEILERQKANLTSDRARQVWARETAHTLFSIGYSHRLEGRRLAAANYYWQSMARDSNHFRPLLSIARLLLPR